MSAPARKQRERRPSMAQAPLLAEIARLGGVRVSRARMDTYAPIGSWVAIVAAGWASVDRGTHDNRGGDPLEYRYTLTLSGWVHAGARELDVIRTRMVVACVDGPAPHECGGYCAPRVYGQSRPCVCACHHRP